MLIFVADHAGFLLKKELILKCEDAEIPYVDIGVFSPDPVDYPDWVERASSQMFLVPALKRRGVFICGSGIGVSIAANRYSFLRAALVYNSDLAQQARAHNDANVLCLGARYTTGETAWNILQTFLNTPFEGGRHEKRVEKLFYLGKPLLEAL